MGIARDLAHFVGLPTRKAKVGQHQSYGATPLGKQKAQEFALSGPRLTVLQHITENAPCSVSELVRECGMSEEKIKHVLRTLIGDGFITTMGQGD